MCEACENNDLAAFPATDVLVIAEDQGITGVHLARVGRVSAVSGATRMRGSAAPSRTFTQDVYISTADPVRARRRRPGPRPARRQRRRYRRPEPSAHR